jgi:hypothetical protein
MNKSITIQRVLGDRLCKLFGRLRISGARTTAVAAIAVSAAILILVAALALPSKVKADDNEVRTFTVDVGFRNPYYQNNVDPAETAKNPLAFSQGDTFIQYGTVFPGGTIPEGRTDFDADKAPGAIGVYVARGTWTTDLPNFEKAVKEEKGADSDLAFATEIFSFADNRGIILTDGILPNAHFSARRVVLGGTRSFRDIVGETDVENIGENITTSYCNLRVTFKIRKVVEGHGR